MLFSIRERRYNDKTHKKKNVMSIKQFEGNLYLFKDNAELVEGFPIKGSSSFNLIDSDNDGKLEIISRLDKFSIVSYEIN